MAAAPNTFTFTPPSDIQVVVDVTDIKTNQRHAQWGLTLKKVATGVEFKLFAGTRNAPLFASVTFIKGDGRTVLWKKNKAEPNAHDYGFLGLMSIVEAPGGAPKQKLKYELELHFADGFDEENIKRFIAGAAERGLMDTLVI